jgi:hypothetical protein
MGDSDMSWRDWYTRTRICYGTGSVWRFGICGRGVIIWDMRSSSAPFSVRIGRKRGFRIGRWHAQPLARWEELP